MPFVQDALLDLDLLVQQRELVVAAHELRPEHVPVGDDDVVLLSQSLALRRRLGDDALEAANLGFFRRRRALGVGGGLRGFRELEPQTLFLLLHLHVVEVLLDERDVLRADLLLELLHLLVHDLELALHLADLILRGDEVLRVHVAVRANRLVQVLLLPQLGLAVRDLLQQVHVLELAHLHLLQRLQVLHVRRGRLRRELLALRLQRVQRLRLPLRLGFVPGNLALQVLLRVLVHARQAHLLLRRALRLALQLRQHVQLALELVARLAVALRVFPLRLGVALELRHRAPRVVQRALRVAARLFGGAQFVQRALAHFVDARGVRERALRLVHALAHIGAALLALRLQRGVRAPLLAKLALQPVRLFVQRVVGLSRAPRRLALLIQHGAQLLDVLLAILQRARLGLDVVRLELQLVLQVHDRLLQALLRARLSLRLRRARLGGVGGGGERRLGARALRLGASEFGADGHHLVAQGDDLRHLVIALGDQRVLHLHELFDLLVLLRGHVGARLGGALEVGHLGFERVDARGGARLLLLGGVHELPRLLDLLFQAVDGGLVILRQTQRGLHLRGVLHHLRVQIAALPRQRTLRRERRRERGVELLVLAAERHQRRVAGDLGEGLRGAGRGNTSAVRGERGKTRGREDLGARASRRAPRPDGQTVAARIGGEGCRIWERERARRAGVLDAIGGRMGSRRAPFGNPARPPPRRPSHRRP